MASWLATPELWNSLVLFRDGVRYAVPGIARVSASKTLEIETHTVAGQDGALATQLGYRPAAFTVDVVVWEEAHMQAMGDIVALFQPRRGEAIQALEVLHPQLEQLGISQVYLMEVSSEPPSAAQGQRYRFRFEEFYPEAARAPRPVQEVAQATGNPSPVALPKVDTGVTTNQRAGVAALLPAMPSAALEP